MRIGRQPALTQDVLEQPDLLDVHLHHIAGREAAPPIVELGPQFVEEVTESGVEGRYPVQMHARDHGRDELGFQQTTGVFAEILGPPNGAEDTSGSGRRVGAQRFSAMTPRCDGTLMKAPGVRARSAQTAT